MIKAKPAAPPPRSKVQRDSVIVGFALAWGSIEIVFLGARPSVLTLVSAILLAPAALRYDEKRRQEGAKE